MLMSWIHISKISKIYKKINKKDATAKSQESGVRDQGSGVGEAVNRLISSVSVSGESGVR